MARKLRVKRTKRVRDNSETVRGPMDLETDPMNPDSGVSSHWQELLETMELELKHTSEGVSPVWKSRAKNYTRHRGAK